MSLTCSTASPFYCDCPLSSLQHYDAPAFSFRAAWCPNNRPRWGQSRARACANACSGPWCSSGCDGPQSSSLATDEFFDSLYLLFGSYHCPNRSLACQFWKPVWAPETLGWPKCWALSYCYHRHQTCNDHHDGVTEVLPRTILPGLQHCSSRVLFTLHTPQAPSRALCPSC